MRSKKGFAFVETIITIVILSASLLYLYSTYNAIISDEKVRLYYDDPAFIYYTNYVRKFLEEYSDIENVKKNYFNDTYIVTLGTGFDALFNETEKADNRINSLEEIVKSFKINQMILVKSEMFDNCYEGSEKYCKSSISNLSYNMQKYVNSLSDTKYDYYLVIEYASKLEDETEENKNKERNIIKCTPGIDKRCQTYYASVGMYGKSQEKKQKLSEYIISQYNGVQGTNNIYHHDGTLENGINDGSYRYAGASDAVKNFVCFGINEVPCPADNLYRIIGVFEDKVKLIKYDYANSNLLGTDGTYTSSKQYPGANYKGTFNIVNNYKWNNQSSNYWNASVLNNTNLNVNYINNIGNDWASKIATTTWKVGGNIYQKIINTTMPIVFSNEITSPSQNATYNAKIGLMYVSDYGFAASPDSWKNTMSSYTSVPLDNWMYMGFNEWTITRNDSYSTSSYRVNSDGYVDENYVSSGETIFYYVTNEYAVRPSFYLESFVTYDSGSGTKSDPIRIK